MRPPELCLGPLLCEVAQTPSRLEAGYSWTQPSCFAGITFLPCLSSSICKLLFQVSGLIFFFFWPPLAYGIPGLGIEPVSLPLQRHCCSIAGTVGTAMPDFFNCFGRGSKSGPCYFLREVFELWGSTSSFRWYFSLGIRKWILEFSF